MSYGGGYVGGGGGGGSSAWGGITGTLADQTDLDAALDAIEAAAKHEVLIIACSDETTDLTTGTAKTSFRMPYAMTLSEVRASVNTAPVGSTLIVDINEGDTPTTILSTKLSIDAGEKTSETADVPAVISDTALADDSLLTIDIDQIGSSTPGKGLKIVLVGARV